MAKFRCGACGRKGECEDDPDSHRCPLCGSSGVVFSLSVEEVPDEVLAAFASLRSDDGGRDEE